MYRTYAKYFKVYLFSRKNMIPKDYTIADMADDQAKVLKTLGISDACVMGVSQGGMISMHLAAKYPELVQHRMQMMSLKRLLVHGLIWPSKVILKIYLLILLRKHTLNRN